ncbi:MAG TPA: sigma-54 dependent transcriptional regulator [Terriglobia bacterium]|nr:sigma-54 dependent transcriptional regulator [Terriglobia bacterium]
MQTAVLVVDDEARVRDLCVEVLGGLGFEITTADSGATALPILKTGRIDVVLTDVQMPGMGGIELLKTVREEYPSTDVLVMTGYGTIPQAVEAVKLGAYDYITKPFDVHELKRLFARLGEKREAADENRRLRERVKSEQGLGRLIGASAAMQKVYQMILRVAEKRHPVLVLGESGTGKELVARAIHTYGPWRELPFVPVDCGALTPTLIESELFGHVKGAFTGAVQARPGLLAEARGGTVFLDEIGELPVELQSKLLRALQEREIRPLGGNDRVPLEARILAATNINVEDAIEKGNFRKDLYFRLNVVTIRVPPLRDRPSDIPALVHSFIQRFKEPAAEVTGFSPEVLSRLMNYEWPGNVRELENCIQRALALGSGPVIEVRDLPSGLRSGGAFEADASSKGKSSATLQDLERRAIVQALEAAGGDRQRAAKLLGIGKTTIYRKLKEYGLDDATEAQAAH